MLENTVVKMLNTDTFINANISIYPLFDVQSTNIEDYITYQETIINGGFIKQSRLELRIITRDETVRQKLEKAILALFDKEEYDTGFIDEENKINILTSQLIGGGNMSYSNVKKIEQIFIFNVKYKQLI
ncbi:hypothetical protein SAMN02745248_00581 [Hathewaya proteolytica DSM 3090]|uniref:Uncharacterized protein n=1 Tax=Hathewaya proteolytica DSM 3090 TaxID=1121331 RepID=A0A1M6L0Z2_9CLOT|nr:hypothetical protein [Hathewaya proteolytica]SHJ64857.1 hypothetical protein SAMN02745248_00581 [Hathewaya proteolytica DSM 3090]